MTTPFTRREFLMAGGAALAATALPLPSVRKRPPLFPAKKRDIKKGIMWACVPGQMSVMDKFKMIREAGFEGTEIDGGLDRTEVLKARDATGLLIPSVVCSTHWSHPMSDPIQPCARSAWRD